MPPPRPLCSSRPQSLQPKGQGVQFHSFLLPPLSSAVPGGRTLQPQGQMGTALSAPCRPHLLGGEKLTDGRGSWLPSGRLRLAEPQTQRSRPGLLALQEPGEGVCCNTQNHSMSLSALDQCFSDFNVQENGQGVVLKANSEAIELGWGLRVDIPFFLFFFQICPYLFGCFGS